MRKLIFLPQSLLTRPICAMAMAHKMSMLAKKQKEHLALHGYLDALAPRAQSSRVNAGTKARLSNANVATNRTINMAGSPVCLPCEISARQLGRV